MKVFVSTIWIIEKRRRRPIPSCGRNPLSTLRRRTGLRSRRRRRPASKDAPIPRHSPVFLRGVVVGSTVGRLPCTWRKRDTALSAVAECSREPRQRGVRRAPWENHNTPRTRKHSPLFFTDALAGPAFVSSKAPSVKASLYGFLRGVVTVSTLVADMFREAVFRLRRPSAGREGMPGAGNGRDSFAHRPTVAVTRYSPRKIFCGVTVRHSPLHQTAKGSIRTEIPRTFSMVDLGAGQFRQRSAKPCKWVRLPSRSPTI